MFNQVTLMGRMTRDVELKHTERGVAIAKGGIAVDSYAGKDKDGEAKKRTLFLDFVAFETTGENIARHFGKGKPVLLVGELTYQTWEKDGQKRSKHELLVQRFSFIPGGGERDEDDGPNERDDPPPKKAAPGRKGTDYGDDIPF
jgi:single-strand DNA-binding protein